MTHSTRRSSDTPAERASDAPRTAGSKEGGRAPQHLRRGVENALVAFGQGFLAHPDNTHLRAALHDGSLTTNAYFQELLCLVYRLLLLATAEERDVLHPPSTSEASRALFAKEYGLRRLRDRSVLDRAPERGGELWATLQSAFGGLDRGDERLGLPALGGLFAEGPCANLDSARLEDGAVLLALSHLLGPRDDTGLPLASLRDLTPEALGRLYEGLLELAPRITRDGSHFAFAITDEADGNARRTSGSYYTPDSLMMVLLDSALEPVIQHTIAMNPETPVEALLGLSIVDPACGSGHFLLSAARRLAGHVARLQANGSPSAEEYRHALRQVVARCIFGVDLNPMAVELCKVSLWMEAAEAGRGISHFDAHIQCGNALLGATPELLAEGIPEAAWEPVEGDDKKVARALGKQNKSGVQPMALERGRAAMAGDDHPRFVADLWCSAFVWRKEPGPLCDVAPTDPLFRAIQKDGSRAPKALREEVERLRDEHRFFHWHLAFPKVFERGGFDVVLGNPPWIAHAGRAAQPIVPWARSFYQLNFESFADYPTTHGMFVYIAARSLRVGGSLGLVIPSSLSELGGYAPTRSAHDKLCAFHGELVDFGEGQFVGVTQPCMALVSTRASGGRVDAPPGKPWPMARPDLSPADRLLLARLGALAPLPAELFGERGVQSDKALTRYFVRSDEPVGPFTTPIREGTDVRELELLPPRFHVDREGLAGRIRTPEEFRAVRVLIRQTARYPIAALSDGGAFRNSLLAGFAHPQWEPAALVALLSSALIRWLHYMRFRDARQPIMPQVKIGHLRAIPAPIELQGGALAQLAALGERMAVNRRGPASTEDRSELDDLVATLYRLDADARVAVSTWHAAMGPRAARAAEVARLRRPR